MKSYLCNFLLVVVIFYSLLLTPDNVDTARGVFEADVFSPSECASIIAGAERAAEAAGGWTKNRHELYPTVDINVAEHIDHFIGLKELMDERVSPAIEAAFSLPRASLRAQDIFVVKYETGGQDHLIKHSDGAFISFNVLLNDEFEGGGTRFVDRRIDEEWLAEPRKVGNMLMHRAKVTHEGVAITKGSRYILVGFLEVDRVNYLSGKSNGVSLYSSFFSLGWLESYTSHLYLAMKTDSSKETHWFVRSLVRDIHSFGVSLGDLLGRMPHHTIFIDYKNFKHADFYAKIAKEKGEAVYFLGQYMVMTADGKWKKEEKSWRDLSKEREAKKFNTRQ